MSDQPDIDDEELLEETGPEIPNWYRKILAVLFPFWVISLLVLFFGRPNWQPFQITPDWVFQTLLGTGLIVNAPAWFLSLQWEQEQKLKLYDPEAPEIKKIVRDWERTGYIAVGFVVLGVAGIIFAPDLLFIVPNWILISLLALLLVVTFLAFMRANEMESGDWTPPEWMPPMNSNKDNESKRNAR